MLNAEGIDMRRSCTPKAGSTGARVLVTLWVLFAAGVCAVTSEPSMPVFGRAPVASSVVVIPSGLAGGGEVDATWAPSVGESVTARWVYSDADTDDERDSLVQWWSSGRDAPVATGSTFTIPDDWAGEMLFASIIPRSAPPAYPTEGSIVFSDGVQVLGLDHIFDSLQLSNGAIAGAGAVNPSLSRNNIRARVIDSRGFPVSDIDVYLKVTSGKATFLDSGAQEIVLKTDANGEVSSYLVSSVDGDNTMEARLANGTSFSGSIFFNSPIINRFVKPTPENTYEGDGSNLWGVWSYVHNRCAPLGLRSPTREELQQLFQESTSGKPGNYDMCTLHGWPMAGGRCGGVSNVYIADRMVSSISSAYYIMNGLSSESPNANIAHHTCIQP